MGRRGLGSVFKRGRFWWIDYSRGGRQYRISSRSEDRAVAAELLRERLAEARAPARRPDTIRISELTANLLTALAIGRARSLRSIKSLVTKRLDPFFGEYRLTDLRQPLVREFIVHETAAGYGLASVRTSLTYLRRAIAVAVADELIPVGAAPRIRVPGREADRVRMVFLAPAEFDPFHEALERESLDLAHFAEFGYLTGWRHGEVTGLSWAELSEEPEGTIIRLHPGRSKTKQARTLAIAGPLVPLMAARRQRRVLSCPLVFHERGQRIIEISRRSAWIRARNAIGRPELVFHDFRRSAARNLVRAGGSESVVMDVTGHKDRRMFNRYNIASSTDQRALFEGLGKVPEPRRIVRRKRGP